MKVRALLFLCALTAASLAIQDSYRFVRAYKAGEKDRYSVVIAARMPIGELESQMTLIQEIVKVHKNGDADQKTSITAMKNVLNGNELPAPAGTDRSFVQRINPFGGIVPVPGAEDTLNGMNELFTTGSRLAGKTFRIGDTVRINDVDPKNPKNSVTGTAKLESVTEGMAKVVARLEISIATQKRPMKATSVSWIDVATSKLNRMEASASGIPSGTGLEVGETKITMQRIQ